MANLANSILFSLDLGQGRNLRRNNVQMGFYVHVKWGSCMHTLASTWPTWSFATDTMSSRCGRGGRARLGILFSSCRHRHGRHAAQTPVTLPSCPSHHRLPTRFLLPFFCMAEEKHHPNLLDMVYPSHLSLFSHRHARLYTVLVVHEIGIKPSRLLLPSHHRPHITHPISQEQSPHFSHSR